MAQEGEDEAAGEFSTHEYREEKQIPPEKTPIAQRRPMVTMTTKTTKPTCG
jgi:hypothetical protein